MIDDDEPLFDLPRGPGFPRAPQVTPAMGRSPASLPPPLPKGQPKTAAYGSSPSGTALAIPPPFQRPPPGDPFQEPPEPRLPVGVDAEEKLKVFRTIIKGKDEALGRGRALFQAVDQEALQLRALAMQLKTQLDSALAEVQRAADYPMQIQLLKDMLEKDTVRADAAEKKMEDLVMRSAEADHERRELSAALAQVEQQMSETEERLNQERQQRHVLSEELAGLKDALESAQDRVSELARRLSEAKSVQASLENKAAQAIEKVQEAQAQREELAATQERLQELDSQLEALRQEYAERVTQHQQAVDEAAQYREALSELQREQERTQTNLNAAASVEASQELEKLKAENQALKKKLVAAETGLEAAASLRAKVSKLEAQLKATAVRK